MKFIILMTIVVSSLAFGAEDNSKTWTPKYRLQKLDNNSRIQSRNEIPKNRKLKNRKVVSRDRVNTKSSALQRQNPKRNNTKVNSKKVTAPAMPMQSMAASNDTELLELYKRKYKTKVQYQELKNQTLALTQKAVPALVKVIKSADYPDKNRWIAMFMLGRVMGKKSANFISKFSAHPNWMMRLASLKVLLALDQKQYKGIYTRLLKDKAMIVRHQALENIRKLNLNSLAPYVWAMLYDKSNYAGSEGERKRAHIIKQAIRAVGDLGFEKSKSPMLKMIRDSKYKDVAQELDYSLNKLSEKKSPDGNIKSKIHFWTRVETANKIIR